MKVNWRDVPDSSTRLYFRDLLVQETFRNKHGRGAVYMKVALKDDLYMLELATGKLFEPTSSELERVECELKINVNKPSIY